MFHETINSHLVHVFIIIIIIIKNSDLSDSTVLILWLNVGNSCTVLLTDTWFCYLRWPSRVPVVTCVRRDQSTSPCYVSKHQATNLPDGILFFAYCAESKQSAIAQLDVLLLLVHNHYMENYSTKIAKSDRFHHQTVSWAMDLAYEGC